MKIVVVGACLGLGLRFRLVAICASVFALGRDLCRARRKRQACRQRHVAILDDCSPLKRAERTSGAQRKQRRPQRGDAKLRGDDNKRLGERRIGSDGVEARTSRVEIGGAKIRRLDVAHSDRGEVDGIPAAF